MFALLFVAVALATNTANTCCSNGGVGAHPALCYSGVTQVECHAYNNNTALFDDHSCCDTTKFHCDDYFTANGVPGSGAQYKCPNQLGCCILPAITVKNSTYTTCLSTITEFLCSIVRDATFVTQSADCCISASTSCNLYLGYDEDARTFLNGTCPTIASY